MNGLGDVLAVARKARGLTQIELAELVDSPSRRSTGTNQATVTPTNTSWPSWPKSSV